MKIVLLSLLHGYNSAGYTVFLLLLKATSTKVSFGYDGDDDDDDDVGSLDIAGGALPVIEQNCVKVRVVVGGDFPMFCGVAIADLDAFVLLWYDNSLDVFVVVFVFSCHQMLEHPFWRIVVPPWRVVSLQKRRLQWEHKQGHPHEVMRT
jgi:hypothetical protein